MHQISKLKKKNPQIGEEQYPNFPRHLKQVFLRVPVLQSKWSLKNHTNTHNHPCYSSLSDTISHLLDAEIQIHWLP